MTASAAASAGAFRYRLATRVGFFLPGFAAAAWAPLIPFAKARIGVDNGVLGLVLLSAGVGSIVTMPLAGALAGRFGCRPVMLVATLVTGFCLPLLAWVDEPRRRWSRRCSRSAPGSGRWTS